MLVGSCCVPLMSFAISQHCQADLSCNQSAEMHCTCEADFLDLTHIEGMEELTCCSHVLSISQASHWQSPPRHAIAEGHWGSAKDDGLPAE